MSNGKNGKRNGNDVLERLISNFKQSEKNNLQYWASKSEKYSHENVIRSCLSSETSQEIAEKISREIDGYADEEMTMAEIRPLIFARLHAYDIRAARRFQPNELFVRTSGERFEIFHKDKITKSIVKETGLNEETANEIALEVENFLKTFNVGFVSSPLIREVVCVKLIEHGLEEERKSYSRLGIPVYDIKQMISRGISTDIKRENANLQHTPETINWILSGETLEQYSLLRLIPRHIADAHISGDFHIHILSNIATRPNCMQHYPPLFFKEGLKADGTGRHTSVAGSPGHIGVAIQHCAKIMLAAQTQMAGGQSIDCFNVWLAPFLKGLNEKEIKQAAQEFIYELNQSYVARGGQVVFSNINFELGIPEWLKNVPAIGPKGQVVGVYGDYEEESLKFLREYIKIKLEGDYTKKQHMFPNDAFKIRTNNFSDSYKEEISLIHQFIVKYGTPYIANGLPEWQTEQFNYMGCRTRLDSKFAGPWGTQRTGNDLYITLNLPRIAYESKGNDERFFEILASRMQKMAEMLILKHKLTDNSLHQDYILPFLTQKFDEEEYYQLKNTTKSFGYAGLTEAVKVHCGNHLHEQEDSQKFGLKVIQFMRDYADKMTKETGLRFSVIASPAETCAARLVKLDFAKFGKNVIFSGTKESPYYTNSHMVRMDANIALAEKIKIEEAYHPLTNGGHILHIFLGEQSPSPESLLELTKKICKTNIGFFAYTRDYSVCNPCSNFEYGLKSNCQNCGSEDLSRYSRITGYYQRVEGWNPSKKQELKDRYRFDASNCKIN